MLGGGVLYGVGGSLPEQELHFRCRFGRDHHGMVYRVQPTLNSPLQGNEAAAAFDIADQIDIARAGPGHIEQAA